MPPLTPWPLYVPPAGDPPVNVNASVLIHTVKLAGQVTIIPFTIQVQVTSADVVKPHAVAVYVNVCDRLLPFTMILPGVHVTPTAQHSLDAVTVVLHDGGVGLQPKSPPVGTPASTGVVTTVQVQVVVDVAVRPQDVAV